MRHKDFIVAAAMLAAGVVYLGMSMGVPNRDGVDASTVPTVLAVMMIALGLIELTAVWRRSRAPVQRATAALDDLAESVAAGHGSLGDAAVQAEAMADAETVPVQRPDMGTVAITLLLIAAYVALLGRLGFPFATALYLFVQFIVLTPRSTRPRLGLYALIAAGAAVLIFAAFRYGFGLLLPAGPLTPLLP